MWPTTFSFLRLDTVVIPSSVTLPIMRIVTETLKKTSSTLRFFFCIFFCLLKPAVWIARAPLQVPHPRRHQASSIKILCAMFCRHRQLNLQTISRAEILRTFQENQHRQYAVVWQLHPSTTVSSPSGTPLSDVIPQMQFQNHSVVFVFVVLFRSTFWKSLTRLWDKARRCFSVCDGHLRKIKWPLSSGFQKERNKEDIFLIFVVQISVQVFTCAFVR